MSILIRSCVPVLQVARLSPVQILAVRNKTRFRKYGSEGEEHGFDNKNEVRKERWIRKRTQWKQTLGGDHREELGLDRNPNKGSPLYELPDWKYADGTPGIPR